MKYRYKHSLLIAFTLALFLAPFCVSDFASAMSYQSNVGLNFTFSPTLSLTVSGDISIPNLSHGMTANSNSVDITVTTNNSAGYTLKATAGNSTYGNTNLQYGSTASITGSAYSATPTATSLTSGTWGFQVYNGSAWGNLTYNSTTEAWDWLANAYNGLPAYNSSGQATLKDTSAMPTGGSESTKFRIAASATDNQTPGTYENVVTFYAVTKEAPKDIYSLTNMQEFATLSDSEKTSVLSSMTTGNQYQLTDSRDGNSYWVSKLADGNVWMTQDLALNLTASGLTSEASDLGYSDGAYPATAVTWDSSSTYAPTATLTAVSSSSTATDVVSWSLGAYYWNGTVGSGGSGSDYSSSTFSNYTTPDYIRSGSYSSATLGSENHARFGNLYTYNAATAGTGGTIASGSASDSICPKGWRLPTSSGSGSFADLATQASISSPTTWAASPYYILRGGRVYNGSLNSVAYEGYYWTSTISTSGTSFACSLRIIGNASTSLTSESYTYTGAAVRCVAR